MSSPEELAASYEFKRWRRECWDGTAEDVAYWWAKLVQRFESRAESGTASTPRDVGEPGSTPAARSTLKEDHHG